MILAKDILCNKGFFMMMMTITIAIMLYMMTIMCYMDIGVNIWIYTLAHIYNLFETIVPFNYFIDVVAPAAPALAAVESSAAGFALGVAVPIAAIYCGCLVANQALYSASVSTITVPRIL